MKRNAKRIISVIICVLILLGAAPLNGLAELDFSRIKLPHIDFSSLHLPEIRLPKLSLDFFATKASAAVVASGTCGADGDNLTWELTDDGTLTISGTGEMVDYDIENKDYPPWSSFVQSIKTVIITEGVTTIGQFAFASCSEMTSITIPDGVTSIGAGAFGGCYYLPSIDLPDSVSYIGYLAFYDCESLKSITIPEGVERIEEGTFFNCLYLKHISLPDTLKYIGSLGFENCRSLESITVPNDVTEIGIQAFSHCFELKTVTLSDKLETINKETFSKCYKLSEIDIPDSVTKIGELAFRKCTALESVIIGNGVTSIDGGAFYECSELINVSVGDSVTVIGASAFAGCNRLSFIYLPDGVETIVDYAFNDVGCVYYNGNATGAPWGAKVLNGYSDGDLIYMDSNMTDLVACIKNSGAIVIPDTVTSIEQYCFYNRPEITSIKISENAVSIGAYSFYGCSGIKSIVIPDSVTSVGINAFYNCLFENIVIGDGLTSIPFNLTSDMALKKTLQTIVIGNGITNIGSFSGFTSITQLVIPDSVTSISSDAFKGVQNICYGPGMTATGSPWGAKCANGYVDGCLVYEDSQKTVLCGCSTAATGSVTVPDSVVQIKRDAFLNCTGLTAVILPDGIVTIENNAFGNVKNIIYGSNFSVAGSPWGAFYVNGYQDGIFVFTDATEETLCGCSSAATGTVQIPTTVKAVKGNTFYDCESVTKLIIPQNTTSFELYAFAWLSGLKTAGFSGGDYDIEFGWTDAIPPFAFSGVYLEEIDIPNVSTIGTGAFYECEELRSLTIPDSVTTIGDSAFCECKNLENVVLGNSIETIGKIAFAGCKKIDLIDLPSTVTSIGEYAFYLVKNIRYSDRMMATGSPWGAKAVYAFVEGGLMYEDESKRLLLACSSYVSGTVTVPDSVVEVGDNCFAGCDDVTSIVFTSDEIVFSDSMVAGCNNLQSISSVNTATSNGVTVTTTAALPQSAPAHAPARARNNAPQDVIVDYEGKTGVLFCNRNSSGTYTMPDSISYICENAFAECENVTVDIPSSVTLDRIGKNAFTKCKNYINRDQSSPFIIGSKYLIEGLESMTAYTLPQTICLIADSAFSMCASLVSLSEPSGGALRHIGRDSFRGCSSLASVTVSGVETIGAGAFEESGIASETEAVYLGNCLASVPKDVTEFTIGQGAAQQITCIAEEAFAGCTQLECITIPSSIAKIPDGAFRGCTALEAVTIESGVAEIGNTVFKDCESLTGVDIPASVENIGKYVFMGCLSLEEINVSEDNGSYKSVDGVLLNKAGTELIRCPCKFVPPTDSSGSRSTYTVDSRIKTIGEYAFEHCHGLGIIKIESKSVYYGLRNPFAFCSARYDIAGKATDVIIKNSTIISAAGYIYPVFEVPENIETIGKYAFAGNNHINKIVFKGNRKIVIEEGAFMGCIGLTEITIPSTVVEIGESAFENCTSLSSLTFEKNADLKNIGSWAFCNCALDCGTAPFADNGNGLKGSVLTNSELSIGEYAFHKHDGWHTERRSGSSYVTETPDCECTTLRNRKNYLASPKIVYYVPTGTTNMVSAETFLQKLFNNIFAKLFDLLGLTFR